MDRFFRLLGEELQSRGHEVTRVNLCGGDVLDWPRGSLCYHGRTSDWSAWVHRLMMRRNVTDLLVFGDWRAASPRGCAHCAAERHTGVGL